MWIAIWAALALFILGFFGWSTFTLFKQKKSWKGFADKYKLTYQPTGFLNTPTVTGQIEDFRFNMFPGTQETDDVRGQRYLTVIELELGPGMPVAGVLGTGEMATFINTLNFRESYVPELKGWKREYIVRTRDVDALKQYLTDERLKVLCSVFQMKNSVSIYLFDSVEAVLRIETSDPLVDATHLDKIIKTLMAVCKKLAYNSGAENIKTTVQGADVAPEPIALQLEDDEDTGLSLADDDAVSESVAKTSVDERKAETQKSEASKVEAPKVKDKSDKS